MTKDQKIADLEARVRELEAELVRASKQWDVVTTSTTAGPVQSFVYKANSMLPHVRFDTWTTYGRPAGWEPDDGLT